MTAMDASWSFLFNELPVIDFNKSSMYVRTNAFKYNILGC